MRPLLWGLLALTACPKTSDYPDGMGLEGQLDREISALMRQVEVLDGRLHACEAGGTVDSALFSELSQVLAGTEVAVRRVGPEVHVSYPGDHLFRMDGIGLRDEALMSLDMLAMVLRAHPEIAVRVEGHTDDEEPPVGFPTRSRRDLTYAQAGAVATALSAQFGLPEARLAVVARAEWEPVATNDTPSGRRQNRRVVVVLSPFRRDYGR